MEASASTFSGAVCESAGSSRSSEYRHGVPVDDLSVLRGCVARNRALFSPTQIVSKRKSTGTWPDLLLPSQECSSDPRQPSLDILSPSEPNLHSEVPFSVSIQFAGKSQKRISVPSLVSAHSLRERKLDCCSVKGGTEVHCDDGCSLSTPSGLNSAGFNSSGEIRHCSSNISTIHVPERFMSESRSLLNVPFVRKNSLDSQAATHPFTVCKNQGRDYFSDAASSFGSDRSIFSSTCTFQEITSKSHYVKGVDGQVFKGRMEMVQKWFSESNDQQKNMMLLNLLCNCDFDMEGNCVPSLLTRNANTSKLQAYIYKPEDQCNCIQMHLLSIHMEPILHDCCPVNCHDLLSWLPSNLAFYALSLLDPVSLCRASQVCRIWYHMASDYRLWMKFCRLHMWQLSNIGEEKQRRKCVSADGRIMWKAMFSERFRIRRNWLKGFCNVRTFEGHTQGISCIQFDDTRIVSGSWDKTIKVWNRRTNTAWAALTLTGHSGTVRCLHLHDNRLVSGSSDRTIKVWEISTDNVNWVGATCKITMVGHMHTVRCLQADHEKVISGSYDNTLKVWDLMTGMCSLTLRGHSDAVLCLHFHGKTLVSGSKDTTIKVWDLPGGYCHSTLHGHQAPVTCVQFDDTRVISGAVDRLIKIWNLETGQCLRTIDWIRSEGHTGVIRHLQADSWKIVSAADDKTLKVWSLNTGDRLLTLKSHTDGVTCLQFNDDIIVSGSYDKTVKLWDFSVC